MKTTRILAAMLLFIGAATVTAQEETVTPAPKPVPEHVHGDIVYGSPDAPVELIEYASMTCPHCKSFNDTVLPFLKEELISTGKVRLVFRNYVLNRADLVVAVLSRCTDDPEKTKALIASYFEQQNEWSRAPSPGVAIQSIANIGGVSFERMQECGNSQEIAEHILEMRQLAVRLYQIDSVPTVLINGTKVKFKNFEDLRDKIELAAIGK